MPEISYPYLEEGTAFTSTSLNDRFSTTVGGLNGIVEHGSQRGALSDQHLTTKGVVADEKFTSFTKEIKGIDTISTFYTTWGGNGTYNPVSADTDRTVISDGSGSNLQIDLAAQGLQLGMSQSDKVEGLLVLMNAYFWLAKTTGQPDNYQPKIGAMMCLQAAYNSGKTHWLTFKKTERFQWVRNMRGEGDTTRFKVSYEQVASSEMTGDDQDDTMVMQDMSLRALILKEDLPDVAATLYSLRGAAAVWYPVNIVPASAPHAPPANTVVQFNGANLTVLPLHAKAY